jgi:hypothetical protein
MGTKPAELASVVEFRNRLVVYINYVQAHQSGYRSVPMELEDQEHIAEQQPWLGQEYGRLYNLINRYGLAGMQAPAFGTMSHDVISDAIHRPDKPSYGSLTTLAIQQLDTVIGRLRADLEEGRFLSTPDAIYRLTSPVYWFGRLMVLLRWLIFTNRGRIAAGIGILVVAVTTGIASGVAGAWVTQLMAAPSPSP